MRFQHIFQCDKRHRAVTMRSLESGCCLPRRGHQDAGLAAVEVEVRRFLRSARTTCSLTHILRSLTTTAIPSSGASGATES
jgi:hypothetical protein